MVNTIELFLKRAIGVPSKGNNAVYKRENERKKKDPPLTRNALLAYTQNV